MLIDRSVQDICAVLGYGADASELTSLHTQYADMFRQVRQAMPTKVAAEALPGGDWEWFALTEPRFRGRWVGLDSGMDTSPSLPPSAEGHAH